MAIYRKTTDYDLYQFGFWMRIDEQVNYKVDSIDAKYRRKFVKSIKVQNRVIRNNQ